jgi:aminoglycoside 3-N-acetyltransferase
MNKTFKQNLRSILPPFILSFVKQFKKNIRKKKLEDKKNQNKIITKKNLIEDFQKAGIKEGYSLLTHSSLSKIGYVDGGAQTVVEALFETVGGNGTLLFPAFPANTFNKNYLEQNPVFDILNTPSQMGVLTEYFRKLPGVKRSFHPTDSVCAKGPLAEYYVSEHFGQLTPYNQFSPFYKLCEKKGKILFIGVTLVTCTNLHTVEDAIDFNLPVYDEKIFNVQMRDEKGGIHHMKTKVHNPVTSRKRNPDALIPLFEKEGILKRIQIGEAPSFIVDAAGLLRVLKKIYIEKGITMYNPHG